MGLTESEKKELEQLKKNLEISGNDTVLDQKDTDFKGRFNTKNFLTNKEVVKRYLEKQNPSYEVKFKDGEAVYKKPSQKEWRKLDPSSLELEDLSDIAYDVLSGIPTTAATTAVALASKSPKLAAMAGGAVSGLGETIKQNIGSIISGENDTDATSIGLSTGVGALAPALLGTGATKKAIEKNLGSSATKEAVEKIYELNKGALGKVYDKTAGFIGRNVPRLAGYTPGELSKGYQMLKSGLISRVEEDPRLGSKIISDSMEKVVDAVRDTDNVLGKKVSSSAQELAEKGITVKTDSLLKPLKSLKEDVLKAPNNEANAEILLDVDNIIARTLTDNEIIPGEVSPVTMRNIIDNLNDVSSGNLAKSGSVKGVNASVKEKSNKRVSGAISSGISNIKKDLAEVPEARNYVESLKNYADIASLKDDLQNSTTSPLGFERLLKKDDIHARSLKRNVEDVSGLDLDSLKDTANAIHLFTGNDKWMIPSKGNSNTFRSLGAAAAGAAVAGENSSLLAKTMGALGGATTLSPSGIKNIYMRPNIFMRETLPQMRLGPIGPQYTPYLLMDSLKESMYDKPLREGEE